LFRVAAGIDQKHNGQREADGVDVDEKNLSTIVSSNEALQGMLGTEGSTIVKTEPESQATAKHEPGSLGPDQDTSNKAATSGAPQAQHTKSGTLNGDVSKEIAVFVYNSSDSDVVIERIAYRHSAHQQGVLGSAARPPTPIASGNP